MSKLDEVSHEMLDLLLLRVSSRVSGFPVASPCLTGGSCKTCPFRRFPSRLSCRFAWQAWHFVTFQPVLYRVESVKISRSLARNARFAAPTCLVFGLWFSCGLAVSMGEAANHTLHFRLPTPHSTLCAPHSALHTAHSTLYTLHFAPYTLHSTLYTLHFTLYTPHFTLHTLHSTLYTPQSTLYTLRSALHFTLTFIIILMPRVKKSPMYSRMNCLIDPNKGNFPKKITYVLRNELPN